MKADEGWHDPGICQALNVSIPTIERVRKRFVFEGFEASLKPRRPKRVYSRKLDGEQEARLVTLACSSPPEGYARWSLRLMADWVVQLKIIDSISHETVRQVLDDNELKPWRREEWCIPAANSEFVYHMEDVLDVYKRPVDPKRPLVCFDESPEQLVSETRQALPMMPGRLEKYDYEYRREGVANLFMFFAPLLNWRDVKVTERRTKVDWATACAIWWMFIFHKPRRLWLFKTNSTHIRQTVSMKCLYQQKPSAFWIGWNSIPRPSMEAGSTWLKSS